MRLSFLLITVATLGQAASFQADTAIVKRHEGHEESHDSHSSMEMDMNMTMSPSPASMGHHHGRNILDDPTLEPQQRRYWEQYSTLTFFNSEEGSKFLLWSHAILALVAYGLMAPISFFTSGDRRTQWFYIPFQTVQTGLALLSLVCLGLYSTSAPKLYPGNSYSGFSIAMLILEVARWLAVVLRAISNYLSLSSYTQAPDTESYYQMRDLPPRHMASVSSGEDESSVSLELPSFDIERGDSQKPDLADEVTGPQPSELVRKLAESRIFTKLNSALGGFASFFYTLLNYPMFLVGYAYLLTGLATAFLMGKGHNIFALAAHFIKGFVFYALGFVELARFLGAGASRGWGWNEVYVPQESQSRLYILQYIWPTFPTVEWIQSFLIFFYGATNVFLEHLGNNDGGKWSHKDLQHVSIAFMFFGGGLCGLVLESNKIKSLVEASFHLKHEEPAQGNLVRRSWSRNPMPAIIIFWTGALMSHHQQETPLSTAIHIQWGTMFSLAAVFRMVTLLLMLAKPRPDSAAEAERPQRPFSEVVVCFLLVCGGMIFMASNRETVEGMIYRGLDQMFTLNVSVGITVIMMAYFVACLAVKGWASTRYL